MIKLSNTSKLGCLSWSLQAGDTCAGSKDSSGNWVDACSGCYARGGNYRFANVRKVREHNREDWQRPEWVADMVAGLSRETHFRWFDSGDMYSVALARKIHAIIAATAHCKHWLPTRMHKFPKFDAVLRQIEALPNAVVRRSSDSITGEFSPVHGSTIVAPTMPTPTGAIRCKAAEQDGKCNECRACWSKDVPVVAYVAHGQAMGKLIKTVAVA